MQTRNPSYHFSTKDSLTHFTHQHLFTPRGRNSPLYLWGPISVRTSGNFLGRHLLSSSLLHITHLWELWNRWWGWGLAFKKVFHKNPHCTLSLSPPTHPRHRTWNGCAKATQRRVARWRKMWSTGVSAVSSPSPTMASAMFRQVLVTAAWAGSWLNTACRFGSE